MPEKILAITNKTMIPLSAVAAVWLATSWVMEIKASTEKNSMMIKKHDENVEKVMVKLDNVHERLVKIEQSLEYMKKELFKQ